MWYNERMSKRVARVETPSQGNELATFAAEVRAEYEQLVPPGTTFDWPERTERFVREGSQTLWQRFNQANTGEKLLYAGAALAVGYVGFKILKFAVDKLFDLGNWLVETITEARRESLQLILKLTLGASAIALVPLLYAGIVKGSFSLDDVSKAWSAGGAEGVIKLIAEKFPAGLRSMSADVQDFVAGVMGASWLEGWFESTVVTPDTEGVVEAEVETEEVTTPIGPVDTSWLTTATRERLVEYRDERTFENFTRLISAVIDNEGGIVVDNGVIWFIDSAGELLDLGNWLQFQYFASVGDVIEAGRADPDERTGAYIQQYLKEIPKFWIAASTLEFINLLRGRHASLLRAGWRSLAWGAWPIRLVGATVRHIGGGVAFARFTRDGVIFLTHAGVNVAKLTAQGSVLAWQGGKFVAREVVRQTSRLGLSKVLGGALTRTYTRTVGRQVAHFASASFARRLLSVAGWKGAVTATLWADDATVVGVLDDLVAVGMTAWLAADVYDLIKITRRANNFKRLMEEQQSLEIVRLEGADEATQQALKALEDEADTWDEAAAMSFLSGLARAEFSITRENNRREIYTMIRGKIVACQILEGEAELATFTDQDIETLSRELPPPQAFRAWEVDYETDRETLFAHYRLAFSYVMNEAGWSLLDYEIKDEHTIEVKRRNSHQVMFIHREGTDWYLGADRETSFDLFQAISLANLVNRVEDMLLEEQKIPRGENPFYAHEDGVYVNWRVNDTLLLRGEEDSWYRQFYQGQLGLNTDTIIDSLNWHYRDSMRPRLRGETDDYMSDFTAE